MPAIEFTGSTHWKGLPSGCGFRRGVGEGRRGKWRRRGRRPARRCVSL